VDDSFFVFYKKRSDFLHTEYEVRILEIDVEKVIKKLEELGALLQGDFIQRRYVYDVLSNNSKKWIRLRTNGDRTTLTVKNIVSSSIDGTQELEIEVDNFERCNLLLKELGFVPRSYQENRRIQYLFNGVEIDIDFWPLIPTYMEIEGPSEDSVYHVLSVLGYEKNDVISKDVDSIYLDYGYVLGDIFELKLEEERK